MTFERDMGQVVARWRMQAGLSQEALGEAIGLQQGAISKIEGGKQSLNVHTLLAIVNATGNSLRAVADDIAALDTPPSTPLWERDDD